MPGLFKIFWAHCEITYFFIVNLKETTGKEDDLRSPYLDMEFVKAKEQGIIPSDSRTNDIGGSWSAIRGDTGEATNLNLAHITG